MSSDGSSSDDLRRLLGGGKAEGDWVRPDALRISSEPEEESGSGDGRAETVKLESQAVGGGESADGKNPPGEDVGRPKKDARQEDSLRNEGAARRGVTEERPSGVDSRASGRAVASSRGANDRIGDAFAGRRRRGLRVNAAVPIGSTLLVLVVVGVIWLATRGNDDPIGPPVAEISAADSADADPGTDDGVPGLIDLELDGDDEVAMTVSDLASECVLHLEERFDSSSGEALERWEAAVWIVMEAPRLELARGERRGWYADAQDDDCWERSAEILLEYGIAYGCQHWGTVRQFCPNEQITRAQAVSWVRHAFDVAPARPAGFADVRHDAVGDEMGDGYKYVADISSVYPYASLSDSFLDGCDRDPLVDGEVLRFCPSERISAPQFRALLDAAERRSGFVPDVHTQYAAASHDNECVAAVNDLNDSDELHRWQAATLIVLGAELPQTEARVDGWFPADGVSSSAPDECWRQYAEILFEHGITYGVQAPGELRGFYPDGPISRAAAAKWVRHAYNISPAEPPELFKDLTREHYIGYLHATDIEALADAGIVEGTDDSLFEPERTITREELELMLSRSSA